MSATIIDRGRGPEIAGTRVTVYHLLDYMDLGWSDLKIALALRLGTDQVKAGREYITAHEAEVRADHQVMVERCERGNPPEVQARVDAAHEKFLVWKEEVLARNRAARENADDAGPDR